MLMPSVSVVINTLNRAQQLANALRGLKSVDYKDFEVIVVNGPSRDATEEILKNYSLDIKIGRCSIANLSLSRNIGIGLASGDIIAFLDDDAVPHPMWLYNLAKNYFDPEIGAVGGFTIDNTGVRWQCKKTICDRFGEAYYVNDFFDERSLNRKSTPYYPSLLGANSSFRASYIRQIGGFDETFAYFLDETDVCLRMIDAGFKVLYEPKAVIYHQSAASDLRSFEKIPSTLRPSVISKSYFIARHGAATSLTEAAKRIENYRSELLHANHWLADNGRITWDHKASLDEDVHLGIKVGTTTARSRGCLPGGDLKPTKSAQFRTFHTGSGKRIVLVSRSLPPRIDAGIARWTKLLAQGLAKRGHDIHIVTESVEKESVEFNEGVWTHHVCLKEKGEIVALKYNLPNDISDWAFRVWQEVQYIKGFGLDLVSFPIWDLEGIALIDDESIARVLSLHTSYALAKPFKSEWTNRPIYEHFMVNRMIKGEEFALKNVPQILANSNAIVADMQEAYGVDLSGRVMVAPHGTSDLMAEAKKSLRPTDIDSPLKVLFVGRFEPRKGFDIAIDVSKRIAITGVKVDMIFAGGDHQEIALYFPDDYDIIMQDKNLHFKGKVSRTQLDDLYRDCDIVFMPSRYESFGLVAIEGMSAGKPIIALNAGGLKEVVVDNYNGFTIEDDENVKDYCYASIMKIAGDRALLADLSQNARRTFLEKFSIDAMAVAVENVYLEAIEKQKAKK